MTSFPNTSHRCQNAVFPELEMEHSCNRQKVKLRTICTVIQNDAGLYIKQT